MLRTKKTKQKKESKIENVSTINPALKIILLSYIYIAHNKTRGVSLLGHKCVYGYKLPAPSHLEGFMVCIKYRYTSRFGGVIDI